MPPPPQYLSAAIGFKLRCVRFDLHGSVGVGPYVSVFVSCSDATNSLVLHGVGASGHISRTISWMSLGCS